MASKTIVIVKGSPRERGNSAILAHKVAEGAKAAGARVESFYLHGMDISPCDACNACHTEPYGGCVISDDMQLLYPRILDADAIVIASPVYWFTVSAQTKLFMDRWYALVDANGYLLKGKQFGILMTYGDSDPFNSGAVNALRTFQDAVGYLGAEIVEMVYACADAAGDIQGNAEVIARAYALGEKLGGDRGETPGPQ